VGLVQRQGSRRNMWFGARPHRYRRL
jgi:hypothetical protein